LLSVAAAAAALANHHPFLLLLLLLLLLPAHPKSADATKHHLVVEAEQGLKKTLKGWVGEQPRASD